MNRQATANDDGLIVAGFIVGVGVFVVLPPLIGARLAGVLSGRRAGQPSSLPSAILRLWTHADTRGWPGHPPAALTVVLTVAFTAGLLAAGAGLGLVLWRRGGGAEGMATRSHLMGSLSPSAARRSAKITRPRCANDVTLGELGVPLGRHERSKLPLWAPWTDCHGLIAPTQSGKTLRVLAHQVLAAPGFCLVTSTKPELLHLTGHARERDGHPIWVMDTTGIGAHPWKTIHWSPLSCCRDLAVAERRAEAFIQASSSATAQSATSGFFAAQARQVLTAFLCAAAHLDASMDLVLRWLTDPADRLPITTLHDAGLQIQARQLTAAATMVPETRDGTMATIANALACLTRPDILSAITPPAGDGFHIDNAIRSGATVYVIGPANAVGSTAPLVTAFVEEVLDRARALAFEASNERLDPPALAVLDEVANIAPLPHLPETISDSAGRGVVISYALQSLGQARARWGDDRAAVLIDNSTSLLILGGGKGRGDLVALASLGGQYDARRLSVATGQRHQQRTTSTHRQPVLDPADVRRLAPGRGLLIYRDLPPVLTEHKGIWELPAWEQLQLDRQSARRVGPLNAG